MRNKLLKKADYDKMMKMTVAEISHYLQELEYKEEIDALALDYQGIDLIERVLQRNIYKNIQKLIRISPTELRQLIIVYQKRYDIYNFKTIIRGVFSNLKTDEIKRYLNPISPKEQALFDKLLNLETVEEIVGMLDFLPEQDRRTGLDCLKSKNSLLLLENALDKYYFSFVSSHIPSFSQEGRLYKKLLMLEIDAMNIKTLLRAKQEKMQEQNLKDMFFAFGTLKKQIIERLSKTDIGTILKELEETSFASVAAELMKMQPLSLSAAEMQLEIFLLKSAQRLIKQRPLSVDVILGYMFMKDIEIKNISRITKAKALSLDDSFISQVVVV